MWCWTGSTISLLIYSIVPILWTLIPHSLSLWHLFTCQNNHKCKVIPIFTSYFSNILFSYFSPIYCCWQSIMLFIYWFQLILNCNLIWLLSPCRYQIVVEIIHATTISSLPQLKKQKGTKTRQCTMATKWQRTEENVCMYHVDKKTPFFCLPLPICMQLCKIMLHVFVMVVSNVWFF